MKKISVKTHPFAVNIPGDYMVFLHRTKREAEAEVSGNKEYGNGIISPSSEWIGSRTARFFAERGSFGGRSTKMVPVELVNEEEGAP
jgi:hypothetical protein